MRGQQNIINCVQTKFLSCHFLALGQFYAKFNHSMGRSATLRKSSQILFTGPKFKGKEGYPIADQKYLLADVEQWLSLAQGLVRD